MKLRKFKTIAFASVLNFLKVVSSQLKFVDTNWLLVFGYLRQFLNRVETCLAKLKSISPNSPRDLTKNNHYVTLLLNLAKECEPLAISDTLNVTNSRENSRIKEVEQSLVKVQAQRAFSTKPNY
jgi:predicted nucleic acid-binding protein